MREPTDEPLAGATPRWRHAVLRKPLTPRQIGRLGGAAVALPLLGAMAGLALAGLFNLPAKSRSPSPAAAAPMPAPPKAQMAPAAPPDGGKCGAPEVPAPAAVPPPVSPAPAEPAAGALPTSPPPDVSVTVEGYVRPDRYFTWRAAVDTERECVEIGHGLMATIPGGQERASAHYTCKAGAETLRERMCTRYPSRDAALGSKASEFRQTGPGTSAPWWACRPFRMPSPEAAAAETPHPEPSAGPGQPQALPPQGMAPGLPLAAAVAAAAEAHDRLSGQPAAMAAAVARHPGPSAKPAHAQVFPAPTAAPGMPPTPAAAAAAEALERLSAHPGVAPAATTAEAAPDAAPQAPAARPSHPGKPGPAAAHRHHGARPASGSG